MGIGGWSLEQKSLSGGNVFGVPGMMRSTGINADPVVLSDSGLLAAPDAESAVDTHDPLVSVIGRESSAPASAPQAPAPGLFTTRNLLIAGGLVLACYFLFRSPKKERSAESSSGEFHANPRPWRKRRARRSRRGMRGL